MRRSRDGIRISALPPMLMSSNNSHSDYMHTFLEALQKHSCIVLPHVERKLLLGKHKLCRTILAGFNVLK